MKKYIEKHEKKLLESGISQSDKNLSEEQRAAVIRVVSNNTEVVSLVKNYNFYLLISFIYIPIFIFGTTFLVLSTQMGDMLASANTREWILNIFPDAQLWINSSIVFRDKIYLLYPVYALSFLIGALMFIYFLITLILKPRDIWLLAKRDSFYFPHKATRFHTVNWLLLILFIWLLLTFLYAGIYSFYYGFGYENIVSSAEEYRINRSSNVYAQDVRVWNVWFAFGLYQVLLTAVAFGSGLFAVRLLLFVLITFGRSIKNIVVNNNME